MRKVLSTLAGTAALALLAGTGAAQSVNYDFDRSADFSRLKTYAWIDGTGLKDDLNNKRIVAAIDAQMEAKGFTKVESSAHPDVLVAYHVDFDKNLEINGYGTGPAAYRWGRSARVEEVVIGRLTVVMLSGENRNLLWRGVATRELDANASPEQRDKNINKAAEKLFKKYPPES
jgi:Domain of unknown function (DUF4136)